MKTVAVIPVKLNNERIPGKNVKKLFDGTPLMTCIQKTLLQCKEVDEIYVYCSKEIIKDFLVDGVKYLPRDDIYDGANANINAMHYSITQKIDADIYVIAHATAPFLKALSIDKGVLAIKKENYDSVISVNCLRDFIWKDSKAWNFNLAKIPRTQDLEPLYIETAGMYVFKKEIMERYHSRTGGKIYMLEVNKIEAIDIDNPIDFDIANSIYRSILEKNISY